MDKRFIERGASRRGRSVRSGSCHSSRSLRAQLRTGCVHRSDLWSCRSTKAGIRPPCSVQAFPDVLARKLRVIVSQSLSSLIEFIVGCCHRFAATNPGCPASTIRELSWRRRDKCRRGCDHNDDAVLVSLYFVGLDSSPEAITPSAFNTDPELSPISVCVFALSCRFSQLAL